MEHSSWYGGQAQPYQLQEPTAAPAYPHIYNAAAAVAPPAHHYQPPPSEPFYTFSPSSSAPAASAAAAAAAAATPAQYPYHLHGYPPNPSSIPSRGDDPAPASYHLYEPPPGAGAGAGGLQPSEVDGYASKPYGPYMGYNGHAAAARYGYPALGAASYYHGFAGGDARGFSAKDAIRQYGVDPGAYDNILTRPPDFSMHQNKATHPRYGTTRRKGKKIAKVVQSAYCNVCKVDCNTQEVLISHRQGKKHKKNLEKLKESIMPKPATATAENKETPKPAMAPTATAETENRETPKHTPAPTATTENKEAPKPAMAPTATTENKEPPEAKKDKTATERTKKKSAPATEVDLETKKRRLLEEGTAADAMRVCTVCNIVCNSEIVFNYHIAGQKHAAMVKKQAASTG